MQTSDQVLPQQSSIGATLKQAREARRIAVDQVAQQLKLSVAKIQAIETDDMSIMLSPTARGLLRSYARLLDFSEQQTQQLLQAHQQLFPAQHSAIQLHTEPLQQGVKQQRRWQMRMGRVMLMVIVLAIATATSLLWYRLQQAPASTPSASSAAVSEADGSASLDNTDPSIDKAELVADLTAQSEQQSNGVTLPNQSGPLKAGQIEIKLVFTQQSWVSIVDAQGRTLYSKLAEANTTELVAGDPPLQLIIGNVSGTRVYAHGAAVALDAYSQSNVARFSVE